MEEIKIARPGRKAFPVRLVDDVFGGDAALADTLREVTDNEKPHVMIVADANFVNNTEGLGMSIGRYLKTFGLELAGAPAVLGGGEKLKSDGGRTAAKLMASMLDAQVGVNDVVVAMGGGSLLDIAGYAAAQVRGGLKLVRMPTSTAAMIDAAFAEYAALNGRSVKDAIRVPSSPAAVVTDVAFARTNLPSVYRAGFGEAMRLAAAQDGALVRKIADKAECIKRREPGFLKSMVRKSAESRAEKGNPSFALWCAARLEAMSGYRLPHGYAVPISICIDAAYSVERGYLGATEQAAICKPLYDIDALDGLRHSVHLVSNAESVLYGLDGWRLSSGGDAIEVPDSLGRCVTESRPDREIYAKVLKELAEAGAGDDAAGEEDEPQDD